VNTVAVDPTQLHSAIPDVAELIRTLDGTAARLGGITLPEGVPPALTARVTHVLSAARQELTGAARGLDPVPDDLRVRVSAAYGADAPVYGANAPWATAVQLSALAGEWFADSFEIGRMSPVRAGGWAAREIAAGLFAGDDFLKAGPLGAWRSYRVTSAIARAAAAHAHDDLGVPGRLATGARVAGRTLWGVGQVANGIGNALNPRLSVSQKVGRTAASVASDMAVSGLAEYGAGLAFGALCPPGFLLGLGAATLWTGLDMRFGLSNKIGDAAAAVGDAAVDAAGDAAHAAKDAAGTAVHGAKKLLHHIL
jgi:hypothetical protein